MELSECEAPALEGAVPTEPLGCFHLLHVESAAGLSGNLLEEGLLLRIGLLATARAQVLDLVHNATSKELVEDRAKLHCKLWLLNEEVQIVFEASGRDHGRTVVLDQLLDIALAKAELEAIDDSVE